MTNEQAYDVLRNVKPDTEDHIRERMTAHHVVLRYGAPGCGEIARQQLMAEALSDLCLLASGVP